MNRKSGIVGGTILVLLGLLFLAREIFPNYFSFWDWPFIIIGVGFVFLIWAILSGVGGLAVPGSIVAGIGGILYYQNLTGAWDSWAYIWALIPAFIGIGVIIGGIIDRNYKEPLTSGLTLILISAVLFFAFGHFFGLEPEITKYWPALLVVLGLISLVRALFSGKRKPA